MRRRSAIVTVIPCAAILCAAATCSPAWGATVVQPGGPVRHLVVPQSSGTSGAPPVLSSSNWSGYLATGTTFTSVASDWVQPAGQCGSPDTYAAFWIGLDGDNNNTVEQAGSEVDCVGGTADYYAWYEMYPDAAVSFGEPVKAGDSLSGSVIYEGSDQFQLTMADSTQGWTKTVTQTMAAAARSSAEIISEAPCCAAGGAPLPLADFGSVSFAGATVNGAGVCDADPDEIVMPDVTVSPLSGCGAFTVTYGSAN